MTTLFLCPDFDDGLRAKPAPRYNSTQSNNASLPQAQARGLTPVGGIADSPYISCIREDFGSEFVNNHRTLQQVISLLICAWRGPVPVLHDHHAMTSSELQNKHSQAFHEGEPIDEIVGLHWHLAFPEDLTGDQCPVRDEATSELRLFACASAALSFESSEAQTMQLTLRAAADRFVSDVMILKHVPQPATTAPRSFLQTLLSEIPLSAVTGVCLV